jgi:UDP-N-acetylglucosamine 2-epimerase
MRIARLMIGNSSSGIMEAPIFKLPVVNIGRRQIGRLRAKNVIDVEKYNPIDIKKAINKALSNDFKIKIKNIINPYGNDAASKQIIDILKNVKINDNLINKKLTY